MSVEIKIDQEQEVYNLQSAENVQCGQNDLLGEKHAMKSFSKASNPEAEKKLIMNHLEQFQSLDDAKKDETCEKIRSWMSQCSEYVQKEIYEKFSAFDTSKRPTVISKKEIPMLEKDSDFDALTLNQQIERLVMALRASDDEFYSAGHASYNLVNVRHMIEQMILFKTVMPRVKPYFAVKSCPDPWLLKVLAWLNAGFDCASLNEIKQTQAEFQALRNTVSAAKMAADGKRKKDSSSSDEEVIALSGSESELEEEAKDKDFEERMKMPALFLKHVLGVNYGEKMNNLSAKELLADLDTDKIDQGLEGNTLESRRIVYAHPCKLIAQMKEAVNGGVSYTTLDNTIEVEKIGKMQQETGKRLKALIRIATHDENSLCAFSSKYGAHMEDIDEIVAACVKFDVEIAGCSFHVGSGCPSEKPYRYALEDANTVFQKARTISNGRFQPKFIDLGGGFYGHSIESFFRIANKIRPMLDEIFPASEGYKFIAEPGRFFCTKATSLITEVYAKRILHPKENEQNALNGYLYLNDSIYHSFNCIIFDHWDFEACHLPVAQRKSGKFNYKIFGCTCDSMDTVSKSYIFDKEVVEGDMLYFPCMGAYTWSGSTKFNGFDVTPNRYFFL